MQFGNNGRVGGSVVYRYVEVDDQVLVQIKTVSHSSHSHDFFNSQVALSESLRDIDEMVEVLSNLRSNAQGAEGPAQPIKR